MFARLAAFLQLALVIKAAAASPATLSTSSATSSLVATSTISPSPSEPVSTFGLSVPLATVTLDKAQVVGVVNGPVTNFTGIPFAEPPVGDLRFRLPVPIESYNGTIDATKPATQCLQLVASIRKDIPPEMLQDLETYVENLGSGGSVAPEGEDCLNINVQVPTGTKPGDKLPVIAFIFGGGFVGGSNEQMPGNAVVARSVEMGQPVIYAAMNYRLHAFGFLGGKEIKEAGVGNLGLQDQRMALRWIQKNIAAFGGDPDKVTLWGPSAGGVSVALQMVTNGGDTEGLFRGAIMNEGSPIPTGDIEELQPFYDQIVDAVGCGGSDDTLECLRKVPAANLTAAAGTLPSMLDYPGIASSWLPRADGKFLTAPPQHLVLAGSVADVPFMTGDGLDEGTVFAIGSFNVTTDDEFRSYLSQFYFPGAPNAALDKVLELYPPDPAAGSPFGTGDANQLAPMFKRMAAFQGDVAFQAPRRFFLDQRSGRQPTWSFIGQRGATPGLGFAHGSDFLPAISGGDLADYVIQFAATLNPNGDNANGTASERTIYWPRYDAQERRILSILNNSLEVEVDNLRLEAMAGVTEISVAFPI